MAPSWPFSCSESHQQPLALDGGAPSTHHGAACVLLRGVSTWSPQGPCVPETLAHSPAGVDKTAWSPPS